MRLPWSRHPSTAQRGSVPTPGGPERFFNSVLTRDATSAVRAVLGEEIREQRYGMPDLPALPRSYESVAAELGSEHIGYDTPHQITASPTLIRLFGAPVIDLGTVSRGIRFFEQAYSRIDDSQSQQSANEHTSTRDRAERERLQRIATENAQVKRFAAQARKSARLKTDGGAQNVLIQQVTGVPTTNADAKIRAQQDRERGQIMDAIFNSGPNTFVFEDKPDSARMHTNPAIALGSAVAVLEDIGALSGDIISGGQKLPSGHYEAMRRVHWALLDIAEEVEGYKPPKITQIEQPSSTETRRGATQSEISVELPVQQPIHLRLVTSDTSIPDLFNRVSQNVDTNSAVGGHAAAERMRMPQTAQLWGIAFESGLLDYLYRTIVVERPGTEDQPRAQQLRASEDIVESFLRRRFDAAPVESVLLLKTRRWTRNAISHLGINLQTPPEQARLLFITDLKRSVHDLQEAQRNQERMLQLARQNLHTTTLQGEATDTVHARAERLRQTISQLEAAQAQTQARAVRLHMFTEVVDRVQTNKAKEHAKQQEEERIRLMEQMYASGFAPGIYPPFMGLR